MYKKIVIFLFLAIIGYRFYISYEAEEPIVKQYPQSSPAVKIKHKAPSFKCDGRQYCSQMNSREEAEFFLRNCPNTKMDGDRDGIPCERQF